MTPKAFGSRVVPFPEMGRYVCVWGEGFREGCSPGLEWMIHDVITSQVPPLFLLILVQGFHSPGAKMAAVPPAPYLHLKQEDKKENMEERIHDPYLKKENFPRNLHRLLPIPPWPKFFPKASPYCKGCWET